MAITYDDIKSRRKKKEEEKDKTNTTVSSSGNLADRVARKRQEKFINFDSFETDLNTMGTTLNDIFNGWQSNETMQNTRASVESMYGRIGAYEDYRKNYGDDTYTDLSELLGMYGSALENWDNRTQTYGNYKNAEAFDNAVKNYKLSEQFSGLSYDDAQKEAKKYAVGTDEYNFLNNYTGYSNVQDFNRALMPYEKVKELRSAKNTEKAWESKTGAASSGKATKEYNDFLKELGYDSEEDFAGRENYYKELEKQKNIYLLKNGAVDEYKGLEQNDDFGKYSQYDPSVNEGKDVWKDFNDYDHLYAFINDVDGVREANKNMAIMAGSADGGYTSDGYDLLYENEVAYYNYLHYMDRQNGTKNADKFLKDMKPTLQKRVSDRGAENREKMLDNPFAATAFSLTSPIATVAGGIGNILATGKDWITGSEYNPYDPLREISNANTHGRQVVGENIAEATKGFELFGQNIPSFIYQTGESVLDTLVGGTTLGPSYTLLMGTNAYQQKAKELTEAGYDKGTVQGLAVVSGALEAAFEYAGFEHLIGLKDADSIGKVLYNALISQGNAEGLEELGTSIGNMIADKAFLGEDSQYVKMHKDLIARGYSEKEANTEVAKAIAGELGWSYMGGYLSGAGLGGATSTSQYVGNKSTGADIRSAEQIGNVFDIASSPEIAEAYDIYTRYANRGINAENATDAQIGNLYNTLSGEVKQGYGTAFRDMVKAKDTINKQKDIREKTLYETEMNRANKKIEKAVPKYSEAQTRMGKYGEPLNKLSDVEIAVADAKRKNEIKAEAKKLSSGVETSVMSDTSKAVEIKGIKDKDTLVTNDGEVAIKDVELSDKDAELLVYARGIAEENATNADLFVSQYDGKTDIDEYANDFNRVVYYAQHVGFTEQYILEHKGSLSTEQVTAIYAETRIKADREKQNAINEATLKAAGKMVYKGEFNDSIIDYNNSSAKGKANWNSLTLEKRREISFAKLLSNTFGYNVVLEKDKDYNGAITKNNTIYIDINARTNFEGGGYVDQFVSTLSHEITHSFERTSPELYRKLEKLVFSTLISHAKGKVTEADLIAKEMDDLDNQFPDKKHTEKEARSEIVARACEDILSMSEEGRKMFDSLTESEKKTFKDKILEILNTLKEWLDELLGRYSSTSEEAKVLRQYETQLKEAIKLWDAMLVESKKVNEAGVFKAEKNTTESGDNQYSFRNSKSGMANDLLLPYDEELITLITQRGDYVIDSYEKLKNIVNLAFDNTHAKATAYFGIIPTVVLNEIEKSIPNIPKELNGTVFKDDKTYSIAATLDSIRHLKDDKNLSREDIVEYLDRMADTIVEFDTATFDYYYQKGQKSNGVLFKKTFVDGKMQSFEIVSSKKRTLNLQTCYIEKGDYKKKKSAKTLLMDNPSADVHNEDWSNFNNNILNIDENVNTKISNKDNTGRTLTEGQQEYFKDSKVIDKDGNLKVMYRGDSSEFTVFDRKKSKPSNLYGRGFYFTDSKEHAGQYGKTREFYLNITNPLTIGQNSITKKQMLNFLKAIENDGEDYDLYNYGEDATAESVLKGVWGKDDFAMLQDINASAVGDLVVAVELFNEVNGTTYDGIILPTETITFNSEQAKLTSNENPTSNKDMQFAMRRTVEQTKDLVAVHNLREEKLLKSLKLGGLPMPSIAIVRASEGYNNFGDISLVFGKETIDPQFMRSNYVYSGDAWTPTYPQVAYKLNTKAQESIKKKIDALVSSDIQKDLGGLHLDSNNMEYELNRHGDMVTTYRNNYAMKYAYLKDNDISIELPTKDKPFYSYGEVSNSAVASFAHKMVYGLKSVNSLLAQHSAKLMADTDLINNITEVLNEEVVSTVEENTEEYQKLIENPLFKPEDINFSTVLGMLEAARNYFHANGKAEGEIDYRSAKEIIDSYFSKNGLEKDYEVWVKDLFSDVIAKEGIRNNKDLYTPSGNRRSFEALHYEHNLENVIKAMKEEGTKGIGGFGGGNIFGAATTEYGSIDAIKADAQNRLQQLPESQYDEIKKGFSNRFFEMASSLPIHKDSFTAVDDAANMLIEAVSKFKTKSGMANYLRSESKGWANYNDYIVDDLIQLVSEIRQMPVGYFEAKPQRAVGFDEVATAIIPDNASNELKAKLNENNIPFVEYESGNEQARIEVLNSLEDAKFATRRTIDSSYDLMGEKDRLFKENKKLKADAARLAERLKIERQVTHGNYFNENQLGAVAGHLRKISNSSYDKVTLMREIRDIFSYIAHSPEAYWEELFSKCAYLADKMLKESRPEVEVNDYYKRILKDIKNSRISLSESQKGDAKYVFGNNYMSSFFGKVIIANDGIPLDRKWQEWAELYPNIFDANISEADQLVELYEICSNLRDASEAVVEYDQAEQVRWLATEIYNQYWNVSTIKTTADKYDQQIKRLNFEHRKMMEELRNNYEERLKKQHKVDKEKSAELVKKIRERKDEEIARAKELGKKKMADYKERAERKTRIQSITANALTLGEWLLKNSPDKHVPDVMKGTVINLVNAIDFSSKRLLKGGDPTQKDISLAKTLNKVKDMMKDASNGNADLVQLYGHGLDDEIKSMMDSIDEMDRTVADNEYILQEMSIEDLQTLDKMVKTIKASVSKMNKFHIVNHAKGIANLSQESMMEMDSLGKGKVYDGLRGNIDKTLLWNNTLPYYAFKRFGKGAMKVFAALQDGWDKFAFNVKIALDFAKETYTDKEVAEWEEEVKTFNVLVPATEADLSNPEYKPQYQKVQMTVPQIMSLYCLQKREQARGHLIGGGIRVADFTVGKKVVSQSDGIVFTETDISTIVGTLTSRQRKVADAIQGFMNTVCSDWGNEVSMARFGIKQFGEENYFPIQSDKNNLGVDDETEKMNSLFRLLNMSFSKSLVENANNRIVISNIFDVFAQHSSDMAKYNALALPVLDSFRWYNYTEKQEVGDIAHKTRGVKQSMENAFGKDGQSYFTTFLKDINGQKEVSRDTLGSGLFTKAKIVSVGANLRVVLLQPTSYVRASAIIDNKYLTKALAHKPKIKMAEEHCGIALWKSMGYYDTNVQRGVTEQIKGNKTWKDKAVEASMKWAEMADKVTWGYLWNACELEVREKRQDLKVGSEEFYDAISKRLREVIYATQVADSTMTRSQMMRSSQLYDKMLTAFGSEPTLAYNMVIDAFTEVGLDARKMGKKEAWNKNKKHMARVVYAYTMTNVVAALVESAFDAYRDDDDEEEKDLAYFMKLYLSNFAQDMSLVGKIPYIKDIVSMFQGYGASRTDAAWMESLYYATTGWWKVFTDDNGNPAKSLKHSVKALSYLSGLPFYNVYRDTKLEKLITETLEDFLD